LKVAQNKPNPFSEFTEIQFSISKDDFVQLEIRNTEGILLYKTQSKYQAGTHIIRINKNELSIAGSTGILIYTIKNSNERISNKMVAVK